MNKKFSVTALAASSSGNAYHLKCGNTELLIDAGISAKRICASLKDIGSDISQIKGIFITHEHSDHVKGISVLSRKCTAPIHMTKQSADEYFKTNPFIPNIVSHELVYECTIGDIVIRSFKTSHDSNACVGYVFETSEDRFGIATDSGYVTKEAVAALLHCNSVILESNYDEKMLVNGTYPEYLKDRIRSAHGHLSNYDCAAFARYLAENGTKNFMLGHLSEENNTPEIAFNISSRALAGFEGIVLKVADRKNPTFFI